ncbi:AarF/UbiB family protein, partial [Streptomyces exfoliatus]
YALEARAQSEHAAEFADDPDVVIPGVVHQCEQVLVTEWIEGTPLSEVIAEGTPEQRNRAGQLLARFLFSGPARTGLLHADPHPGNFRLLPPPDRIADSVVAANSVKPAGSAESAVKSADSAESARPAQPADDGSADDSSAASGDFGDWRLGVLDFGTVDRLPDGLPRPIGDALRMTLS